MNVAVKILRLIPVIIAFSIPFTGFCCSMCKVTINGHTYVGSNEDSWRTNSRIWFEKGLQNRFGSVYVGFGDLPQGGMNEAGLAFDALTTLPKPLKTAPQKKEISNPKDFLKEIMQTCKSVDDVKRLASQYNRQKFYNSGVLFFVDRTGSYLVMESDTLIIGNDDKYLIANFCPSITPEEEKLTFDRYRRGRMFLEHHVADTSSNFCFALTDTMHECRERIGDGTMYSFIADLDKGDFTICFYHDFKHPITFNLKQELEKGDHDLQMATMFSANKEYLKFLSFKTPQNNTTLLSFLFLSGGLFAFSSFFYLGSMFWRKAQKIQVNATNNSRLLIAITGLMLLYYITILYSHQEVFYFPAPYQDLKFSSLNLAAYIPFIILLLIIPIVRMNLNVFRNSSWGFFSKSLFVLNSIAYLMFIGLFFYWGLYNIF